MVINGSSDVRIKEDVWPGDCERSTGNIDGSFTIDQALSNNHCEKFSSFIKKILFSRR